MGFKHLEIFANQQHIVLPIDHSEEYLQVKEILPNLFDVHYMLAPQP
jgi:hypothetical protein